MRLVALALILIPLSCPAWADPRTADPAMLDLAEKSRCLNCHDIKDTVRGPAWKDVAKRYKKDPAALERLVIKVRDGGGGVWGAEQMSPNKRVGEDNIRVLVRWILSLE